MICTELLELSRVKMKYKYKIKLLLEIESLKIDINDISATKVRNSLISDRPQASENQT